MTNIDQSEIANASNTLELLISPLRKYEINPTILRAVMLQLVGVPEANRNFRPNIHLAIVAETSTNLSQLLADIAEVYPQTSRHVNGTNASSAGIIGTVKGESLTRGPLLDDEVSLTTIEKIDASKNNTQLALQQIIDSQEYSFSKASFRETIAAPGSILIATNPEYGQFSEYEGISEQIPIPSEIIDSVDLLMVNNPEKDFSSQVSGSPTIPIVKKYISQCQNINPSWDKKAKSKLDKLCGEIINNYTIDNISFNQYRLEKTLLRLSEAHSRLQLKSEVEIDDINEMADLVAHSLDVFDRGSDDKDEVFEDGEISGQSQWLRDRRRYLKATIRKVEEQYDKGAPLEEVIYKTEDDGRYDEKQIRDVIEKLRTEGDLYEPLPDTYRVI